MKDTSNKKPVAKLVIGAVLILISVALIIIGGLLKWIPSGNIKQGNATINYGVEATFEVYSGGFLGDFTSKWSFLVLVFDIIVVLSLIYAIIKAIRAHQAKLIICQIIAALGFAFVPYLVILTYRLMQASQTTVLALWVIAISIAVLFIGMLMLIANSIEASKNTVTESEKKAPVTEALSEDQIRVIAREEIEKYNEEQPAKKELSEEDVTKISQKLIDKALNKHLEAKHSDAEDEEPEEEEAAVEEVAVIEEETDENDPFAKLKSKRRASFETRLKNSEFDLRHKYYDLRDHIKSYGLKNRISIPGDSFSAHRKRYVFLTINGKHIKAYFAANPDDYKDSAIPVERTTAKKYEDLPLQFKIRSDLSFRRACKLVDDMLSKEGYEREDKPIKNTQNSDEQ